MAAAMSASLTSLRSALAKPTATPTARGSPRLVVARSNGSVKVPAGALAGVASLAAAAAAPARANEATSALEAVAEAVEKGEAAAVPIDTKAIEAALQGAEVAVQQAAAAAAVDVPQQVEKYMEQAAEALKEAAVAAAEEGTAGTAAEQADAAASVSAELNTAAGALKEAAQAAKGAGAGTDVVEAIQTAVSTITEAAATAQDLAKPALQAAEPAVKQAFNLLSTTDPAVLAEYALGAVAVAYVLPPLANAAMEKARGYAGDVQPTGVLDALVSQSGNALVDIRSAKDKEELGVADLADPTKLVELEFVAVDDSKLYSRLRNATEVEAESTAIQIAALKKLNKGMTLYIIDTNGTTSRAVAKELAKRGFGRAFVVAGGFQAWSAAKLRTRSWNPATALLAEKAASVTM